MVGREKAGRLRGADAAEVRHAKGKDTKGHKTTSTIKAGFLINCP